MIANIRALTAFRFLTAWMIFLSHCGGFWQMQVGITLIDTFIANSSVFITGFFVLSGYILTHVYGETDFSQPGELARFYLKRFARIYPVYAIGTMCFFIIFGPAGFTPFDWLRVVVNDIFLTQSFFLNMDDMGINCITWSISVEAFFYLVFPMIVTVFYTRPRLLIGVASLISLIVTVNIFGDLHTVEDNVQRLALYYSNPLFRINECMMGMGFYWLQQRGAIAHGRFLSPLVAVAIMALTISPLSDQAHSHMGAHLFLTPLFAYWLVLLHHQSTGLWAESRWLEWLGKISYSFYVWQFITIILGVMLIQVTSIPATTWFWLLLPCNMLLAFLSYRYIEEPARRFIVARFSLHGLHFAQ